MRSGGTGSVADSVTRALDARDGFFDLKPAPKFYPPDYSLLWILLTLFVLSLLLFLVLMVRKRRQKVRTPDTALPPLVWLGQELDRLKAAQTEQRMDARAFASELSLTLRGYFERTFAFPATDRTVTETIELLAPTLSQLPGQDTTDSRQSTLKETRALLRFLERTAFAGRNEMFFTINSEELSTALEKCRAIANSIEQLTKEATASVEAAISGAQDDSGRVNDALR